MGIETKGARVIRRRTLIVLVAICITLALAIGFLWLGRAIGYLTLAIIIGLLGFYGRKGIIRAWRSGGPIRDITRWE